MHKERYVAVAEQIGRKLAREAFWNIGRCNWLGWCSEFIDDRWQPMFRALGPSVYDGVAGIALFLVRLVQLVDDAVLRRTAEGALAQCMAASEAIDRPGAYFGAEGLASVLIVGGRILECEQSVTAGFDLLVKPRPLPEYHDVLVGKAGQIQVYLAAATHGRRDHLIALATRCGDALLAAAQPEGETLVWRSPTDVAAKPLTGYSHGAAGIATALAELGRATDEPRFMQGAVGAIAYERDLFDAEADNWPDFRSHVDQHRPGGAFAVSWCNGAPGIGLSRTRLLTLMPNDNELPGEIASAVAATRKNLSDATIGNYSLCHGIFGNAELLLDAGLALGQESLLSMAEHVADEAAERVQHARDSWPCGGMSKAETPTLMIGLAGIGYHYLRLAAPERVPSILLIGPDGMR